MRSGKYKTIITTHILSEIRRKPFLIMIRLMGFKLEAKS